MNGPPAISVIMPVYNGEPYLLAALHSVLTQTFRDFELLIIEDASPRDRSRALLREFVSGASDPRIRLIEHEENRGLAATLNHGISLAQGRYIARQDQDDLSAPERLQAQFAYMEAQPHCALLGTGASIVVGDKPTDRAHVHPQDNLDLQAELIFNNPFVHSSVIMRRDAVEGVGGYTTDRSRQPPEDYELWSRIARRHSVANLADKLLVYREVEASMSRVSSNPFEDKLVMISGENLAYWSQTPWPDRRCADFGALVHGAYPKFGGSNLPDMERLLTAALEQISTMFAGAIPKARADDLRGRLRHHHTIAAGVPEWSRDAVARLRRVPAVSLARRIWRKVLPSR